MVNAWIIHVKDFASKNGMKYGDALRDEDCKKAYRKSKQEPTPEPKQETQPEEPATQIEQPEQVIEEKKVKKQKKKKKVKKNKVVFK